MQTTTTTSRLRGRNPLAGIVLVVTLSAALLSPARSAAFSADRATREEALQAAYPGARFQAERIFLTESEKDQAARESGQEIPSALIARYLALLDDKPVGRAYIDTHIVRTKKESLLICLDQAGQVKRIEVTAFLEPPEYQASGPFYDQYKGRALDPDLNLNRAIRPIAGATLTARAANQAVRRVLAIDRVVAARGGGANP